MTQGRVRALGVCIVSCLNITPLCPAVPFHETRRETACRTTSRLNPLFNLMPNHFRQHSRKTPILTTTLVADEYPTASIQGLDLSPIQPDYVPPNVQFLVDDIEHENGWDYPENHFDFIHIRHTLYSIHDAKGLIERAYK